MRVMRRSQSVSLYQVDHLQLDSHGPTSAAASASDPPAAVAAGAAAAASVAAVMVTVMGQPMDSTSMHAVVNSNDNRRGRDEWQLQP